MPRIRIRNPQVPQSLQGWLLVDRHKIPRYWSTVWSAIEAAHLGESTLGKKLGVIEQLYQSVEAQLGEDRLDQLIAQLDFDALESCLEGYFVGLRNRGSQNSGDLSGSWRTAIDFVRACTERLGRNGSFKTSIDEIHARLLRLERLYNSLNLRRVRRPETVRALPALVLEDLYDLILPDSQRNPFRSEALRWRNFAIVLLMLHQGLRRGELLVLAVDALKMGEHPETGEAKYWLDVIKNPYEPSDPRRDDPGLKNANAVRQIPVAETVASAIEVYVSNYRGRQRHSYLFSSQEGNPLAKRSFNDILTTLTKSLSEEAKAELRDRRKLDRIHPHALRHTCAVVRLKQFVDSGSDMDLAIQQLRVFFGWSRTSQMPHLYARAYFEDRLSTVWKDAFDVHVSTIRGLSGGVKA